MAARRSYMTTVVRADDGTVLVPVPFDPDEAWGPKTRHLVAGTVAGIPARGEVRQVAEGHGFALGPAWLGGRGTGLVGEVHVVIDAEGPQRADLAPDIAAALEADPAAGEAFDALAQFYRKAFLAWIDATSRRPEQRPLRIAEMIRLLRAGEKQRH